MSVRPHIVLTIWKKELNETLRDRRTLFVMLVLPMLLYPMLLMGLSRLAESESAATHARPSVVAIWGTPPPGLEAELANRSTLKLSPWLGAPADIRRQFDEGRAVPPRVREVAPPDNRPRDPDAEPIVEELPNPVLSAATELLTSRQADAVLVVWNDRTTSIYSDSVREESRLAGQRVRRAIRAYDESLRAPGLELAERDVARGSRQAGRMMGTILPMMLLILCIAGGLYPAIDLTAGEKERGTMQTLMCAPILPGEIIGGKFLAVWTMMLASALANVVSLALTLTRSLPLEGASIPFSSYALTVAMLMPVTLLTSALFLALAVFARDFKEGQGFLTPVHMAVSLPAMVTMLPTIELNAWTTFVPIVNIALLIKALLISEARADLVFLTMVSSLVYAALALALAVRVFTREQVLLGGRESFRNIVGFGPTAARTPSPGLALLVFAIALVLAFYGTLALESRGVVTTVLVMQYGFFLLPVVAIAAALRFDFRETFSLRPPRIVLLVAAVTLGLTAWTFAAGVLLRLAPPPETVVKALERLIMLGDDAPPLWVVWLVVGVTPAICEEMLFRGFILTGLRPLGAGAAIGISALVFGLAHASIYRLLPTFFLGLVLGIVVWRTGSLFYSIVLHAANNALLATMTQAPALARMLGLRETSAEVPWTVTIAGSLLMCAALAVFLAMSAGGTVFVRNRTDLPSGEPPLNPVSS